jgi:hypothetical protein
MLISQPPQDFLAAVEVERQSGHNTTLRDGDPGFHSRKGGRYLELQFEKDQLYLPNHDSKTSHTPLSQ